MLAYYFIQVKANTIDNDRREGDGIENQKVPPQENQVTPQVPNSSHVGNVSSVGFRTSMIFLAQALVAQTNREVVKNPIGECIPIELGSS